MRDSPNTIRTWPTCVLPVTVAVGLTLIPQHAAGAQKRIDPSSAIEVHHRAGKIYTGPRRDESSLADVNRFEIRKGSKVTVVVGDQNPLLFTYDVSVTESETEQHKIAAQFAVTLGAALKPFQSSNNLGGGLDGTTIVVEGLDFKRFTQDLDSLNSYLLQIPAKLTQSLGNTTEVATLKEAVSRWDAPGLATRIRQGYDRLAAIASKCLSTSSLGTSAGTVIPCDAALDRARAAQGTASSNVTVDSTAPGISNTQPPRPGATPKTQAANGTSTARPSGPKADGAATNGTANRTAGATSEPAVTRSSGATVQGFVTLALALQTRIGQASEVLQGFASDVAALNTPRTIADRVYGLKNQTVELTIKASPKYDDFLNPSTKAQRNAAARKTSIVLEPYTPVSLGLAPAAVLLFIKNPTYSAAAAGSGFTVNEVDEDATLYNLAAMLTITPRKWDQPTFGGSFELGVSPTKDKIGLYAGAGVSVQDLFIVGAGFAWQQVHQLAKGLTVGQTIATADVLKTDTKFKPGLYLHLTVK